MNEPRLYVVKQCDQCYAGYESKRSTSRYCSAKCRKLAFQVSVPRNGKKVSVPADSKLSGIQIKFNTVPPWNVKVGKRQDSSGSTNTEQPISKYTYKQLMSAINRYADTWVGSPESVELLKRLETWTLARLEAGGYDIPVRIRAKHQATQATNSGEWT